MSVADIPGMGCYFFSYEWILSKITSHPLEILPRENLNPLRYILAGGTTGMICWFSILPADVLKSRVQIAPEGKYPRGVRDAFIALVSSLVSMSSASASFPSGFFNNCNIQGGGVFFGYEVALKLFNWTAPE
ncbi:unnamed protein product [Porites lobata]|uniref:Uncharacterized protein n=1 Tax=Porites lobata TaxID=104759 RepID=A0ABN8RTP1_9CNID|nr:unnamed protein product [Porites lobata]